MGMTNADNENALIFYSVENQVGFVRVHPCWWCNVEPFTRRLRI
jgi:hypothetical protein